MPVTSESVLITADAAAAAFYSCMSVCLHIQFNGYGGTRENEDCVDYELAMLMMMMTTILPGVYLVFVPPPSTYLYNGEIVYPSIYI